MSADTIVVPNEKQINGRRMTSAHFLKAWAADEAKRQGLDYVKPPRPATCGTSRTGKSAPHTPQTCQSIWACPYCSWRIGEARATEIKELIGRHRDEGAWVVSHFTLECENLDLAFALDIALKGFTGVLSGAGYIRHRDRFGILGLIRTTQLFLGVKGWTIQISALWALEKELSPEDLAQFNSGIRSRWTRKAEHLGGPSDSHRYVVTTKNAPGTPAHVLEAFEAKPVNPGMRHPFELLDRHTKENGKRWVEYFNATAGRQHTSWSKGIKDRYGIGASY